MALSCDLKDIAQAAAGCEEQLSGLGNMVYVAYPEDLQAAPTYEENSAAFASTSFKFSSGKGAWKIRCKKQSVQLTATGNEGPKGFNVQLVFVVDRDVENASQVIRILKNRGDAIFFVENPSSPGTYRVVYDPVAGTEINANYDSGTTPDSDSGYTVTVTSNPNRYGLTSWTGTLTVKSELSDG